MKIAKFLSLILLICLVISMICSCSSSPYIDLTLTTRLAKYKPRWVPNFLREFYPADESFPVLWGGDVELDGFSCRIGLYDRNANGRFDEYGKDILVIAPFGQDEVTLYPHATAAYLREGFILNLNEQYFRLSDIDSNGQWIQLLKVDKGDEVADVQFMEKLPDVPLKSLSGDSTSFHQYLEADKLLYIEVWSSWHQYSFESTPYLKKTAQKYTEKLNVLTLIYNEVEMDRVHRNNAKHMVNWPQAIYSEKAGAALLHLGWVPYGVLYSGDGRMIRSGIRPYELDSFLDEYL